MIFKDRSKYIIVANSLKKLVTEEFLLGRKTNKICVLDFVHANLSDFLKVP